MNSRISCLVTLIITLFLIESQDLNLAKRIHLIWVFILEIRRLLEWFGGNRLEWLLESFTHFLTIFLIKLFKFFSSLLNNKLATLQREHDPTNVIRKDIKILLKMLKEIKRFLTTCLLLIHTTLPHITKNIFIIGPRRSKKNIYVFNLLWKAKTY